MEEREAGLGWPMSTCHSLVPLALQGLTEINLSGLALCDSNYSINSTSGGCQSTLFSVAHGINQ